MEYIFFFLIVAVFFFFLFLFFSKRRKQKDMDRCLDMVFLRVSFPKGDSKEDKEKQAETLGSGQSIKDVLEVMDHFYTSLHAIHQGNSRYSGEDFFSVEMVVLQKLLNFYIVMPRKYQNLFEKQLSAFFPEIFIDKESDYDFFQKDSVVSCNEYELEKESFFPLNTYKHMGSDPLNPIINVMSKLDTSEGVALQVMLRPLGNGWQQEGRDYAKQKLEGKDDPKGFFDYFHPKEFIKFFARIFSDSEDKESPASRNTSVYEEQLKVLEEKNIKKGFETIVRVIATAPEKDRAEDIKSLLHASLSQYAHPDGNSFTSVKKKEKDIVADFVLRNFPSSLFLKPKSILVPEELSSLYHFPNIKYNQSPVISWQEFKIAPAPHNLPEEGVLLGINSFRGEDRDIRIMRSDRRRHFYLIGKSGTGKSTLLETCIKQDLMNGEGVCVVDPHGDLVETMLEYVPRSRADDVIYFNPGDLERPLGLNILEAYTPDQKEFMAQEALAIFIKLFGEEIMGPRLQNYFRNGALTLLADDEEGATILDIVRLYTDDAYREYKSGKVKDNAAVRSFWDKEYANTGERERQEIIPYFAAKFGPFFTNMQIRNIIGQTKSGFDFRDVMDNKKILFVNLSKGKLGDLNAKLIGMIIVAKIQMAAMGRVDTPEEERKDFYLYVDEFQNFVTDSFASILSEARKYRLNLIIAHQYISQITKLYGGGKGTYDDTTIKDAVFGNVGSMMCFKIGSDDAETVSKEFAPVFSSQDLINIANYHAYIKLNINNTTSRAFSMKTIYDPSGKDKDAAKAFIQLSRLKYGRERAFVDKEISRRLA
jgi:hypothetical protein